MGREVLRRRGKELRERAFALLLVIPSSPLIALCALGIKLEGLVDRRARGPVFFYEDRVSRGQVFKLIKFRTLDAAAIAALGPGPTHIKGLEESGHLTRMGRLMHKWYLDELPQLWNIVRGDMFLIGTRPWPIDIYEEELSRGITRKRDMPAGLIGPIQSRKGEVMASDVEVDLEYWDAYRHWSSWRLLRFDLQIIFRSLKVMLEHKGL
jgi:lipopolysaccharide/colanic/teichoic acid biosynthesis glycosyltransferase